MSEKFPKAKYEPLTREEMKSLVEGKGVRRPAVCMGHWVHIDEMKVEDQPVIENLFEEYPEDAVVFYKKCGFQTTKIEKQYGNDVCIRYDCIL